MSNEITGAKVFLQNLDGSQSELTNWKKVVDKTTYLRVVNNDEAKTETHYPIVQPAPVVQQPAIIYGCMFASVDAATEQTNLKSAGLTTIRIPVFWGNGSAINKVIDQFLQAGFNVVPNFNYLPTTSPVLFPTDSTAIRNAAETFFAYYAQFKNQLPFVTVENEWDNKKYRSKIIVDDYINELSIITEVAHKYGFKVSDAGITVNGIHEWYYSILSTPEAKADWNSRYITGKNSPDFASFCAMVNDYCNKAINIPFDYSNIHWYNRDVCNNGFAECAKAYMMACGKKQLLTNEFGIWTATTGLFVQTVNEIRQANPIAMIAYSGTATSDAEQLSTDELIQLTTA